MSDKLLLYDKFDIDLPVGKVIGTLSDSGHKRLGVDIERVISIDNGALRIAPLIEPGFARAVLSYGPFKKRSGLGFAVYMVNGHNTAQAETLPDTFRQRLMRWLRGSETDPVWERVLRWSMSGRVFRTLRQFRWWRRTAKGSRPVPPLDENLAVGWFAADIVPDPRLEGHTFIMHALGPDNGELWLGSPVIRTRSLRGVQNLPLLLVAIVRKGGMVYYVSSVDGAPAMAPHHRLRPVAVDQSSVDKELYIGIQQSVLGQIGFRLDTRIEEVRIGCVDGYDSWRGGALAADCLIGGGELNDSEAEVGDRWQVRTGKAQRSAAGAYGVKGLTIAILEPKLPAGLIHAEISLDDPSNESRTGYVWRFVDEYNHWRVELNACSCSIIFMSEGNCQMMAMRENLNLSGGKSHRLQVLDSGSLLMAYLDGEPLAKGWIEDKRLESATPVGLLFDNRQHPKLTVRSFEVHPRYIDVPDVFNIGSQWLRFGSRLVLADEFTGELGDLDGQLTSLGGQRWSRLMGKGEIVLTGDGAARVNASVKKPCPGRTAYCVDWPNAEFTDLSVTIIPPGTEKGQKHRSRAGFIIYQDPDNYITVNVWLDDWYAGASVSSFYKFRGFEDIYDAVWSNVGDRLNHGCPSTLRLCCDGKRLLAFINDEPVLYRALRDVYFDFARLAIKKVGILANWEWGCDTGTRFERFESRI